MDARKKNTLNFWNNTEQYFDAAHSDENPLQANPALQQLFKTIRAGDHVLDVGCGEGSKAAEILQKIPKTKVTGVDISTIGIRRAKRNVPKAEFLVHDIERLPFKDSSFDVTYSTYVFEHTTNPQQVLTEMIRVTRPRGNVIIVCPNFGSPLYPSPITPILAHAVRGAKRDIGYLFRKPKSLEWYPQVPVLTKEWKPDWDTTILPYVYSLHCSYPKAIVSSTWRGMKAGDDKRARIIRIPFKLLGLLRIYPFRWWGSTLYFNLEVSKERTEKKRRASRA